MSFFFIFLSFFYKFSFTLYIGGGDTHIENVEGPKLGQNWVFFHKFASLVFLDIAQVCNLDQGLTSTVVEPTKKNYGPN